MLSLTAIQAGHRISGRLARIRRLCQLGDENFCENLFDFGGNRWFGGVWFWAVGNAAPAARMAGRFQIRARPDP
jgi:hypothetical protein